MTRDEKLERRIELLAELCTLEKENKAGKHYRVPDNLRDYAIITCHAQSGPREHALELYTSMGQLYAVIRNTEEQR